MRQFPTTSDRVKFLVNTSIQDMTSGLCHYEGTDPSDVEVVKAGLSICLKRGEKTKATILRRKYPTKAGQMLQLYVGQRTSGCQLIANSLCTAVKPVQISPAWRVVRLDGRVLSAEQEHHFAILDGFVNVDEFYSFFTRYSEDELRNELEVIYWR